MLYASIGAFDDMKAIVSAITLALTVGVVAPTAALAVDEVEATHYRAKKMTDCASKEAVGDVQGTQKGEFVRTVAGIRLWRKDARRGPHITYCLEVNNGYHDGFGVDPEADGMIKLPRWMRRHAESAQIVVNKQCWAKAIGYSAGMKHLWSMEVQGFPPPRPAVRRWRALEIRERSDNRTVYVSWQTFCGEEP